MPPIIVHQAKEYTQDLHFKIPLDWTVHHTPYGYMDRYSCLKATTQFANICVAFHINNQIVFSDRHDSHLDNHTLMHMDHQNIQHFVLKSDNSGNDHTNDNGTNANLKLN